MRPAASSPASRFRSSFRHGSPSHLRYQDEPGVLTAYVKIADAYRRMNQPDEARTTIQRAKRVLQSMKPESKFAQTTNHSRQEWTQLLDWLAQL